MDTAKPTSKENRRYSVALKIAAVLILILIAHLEIASADSYFFDDFSGYSNRYAILEDFEDISDWVANETNTNNMSLANMSFGYGHSIMASLNNSGEINKSFVSSIDFKKYTSLRLWFQTSQGWTGGFIFTARDGNGNQANWNINSQSNSPIRMFLAVNNSAGTYSEAENPLLVPPASVSANFNWSNVTRLRIRESSFGGTFPVTIWVDDIRLVNESETNGTWALPNEISNRKGDCSVVNESNTFSLWCTTFNNVSGLAQTGLALFYKENMSNFEYSYVSSEHGNTTDNFDTLWSFSRVTWLGHHDLMSGYLALFRTNLTGGATDNTESIKRRNINGSIGSPSDSQLTLATSSYLTTKKVTVRLINNNIKVFVNDLLTDTYFDALNDTAYLSNGSILFRVPGLFGASFTNFSVKNYTSINYWVNVTDTYITNGSGYRIDGNSIGDYYLGLLRSNLTTNIFINITGFSNPLLFYPNYSTITYEGPNNVSIRLENATSITLLNLFNITYGMIRDNDPVWTNASSRLQNTLNTQLTLKAYDFTQVSNGSLRSGTILRDNDFTLVVDSGAGVNLR